MGQAAKLLRFLEAEEYLAWEASQEERHELLEGVPHAMTGASEAHNLLVGNLYVFLRPGAQEKGCRVFSRACGYGFPSAPSATRT